MVIEVFEIRPSGGGGWGFWGGLEVYRKDGVGPTAARVSPGLFSVPTF